MRINRHHRWRSASDGEGGRTLLKARLRIEVLALLASMRAPFLWSLRRSCRAEERRSEAVGVSCEMLVRSEVDGGEGEGAGEMRLLGPIKTLCRLSARRGTQSYLFTLLRTV